MDARELLFYQLEDAGYQLEQVLQDFPEAALDSKMPAGSMTPREVVVHLIEAYIAFDKSTRGEQHDWGSYRVSDCSTQGVMSEFRSTRSTATANLGSDDQALKNAHAYIVAHDYYHVGQLCAARLAVDPEWDPYAIYR